MAPPPPQTSPADPPDQAYRLPRSASPTRYELVIEPDLAAATFTGTAAIDLEVREPVTELVCNAAELEISGASVVLADGSEHPARVTVDADAERATFALEGELTAGPVSLRCSFAGILNDKLHGFYRSTYSDDAGDEHTIATTQMEATDARRAFPCWDEPDLKAIFDVTLVVDADLQAYSNSPVAEEHAEGDRRRVHFEPTMKMSTYLVAFVVGQLAATEPLDVDGVPVRVIHVPGKEHLSGYALEVAAHALRFFSAYFDIPYPADKLDLVAIPDFAFGAMENLGCVTFRETALLIDPEAAARTELERVALVVAHELAHMWFGDLVTMRWWEGIWLNEAFATFMEGICTDAFRPGWEIWVSFGLSREAAMALDGLHATRPIEYPVGAPADADGMFDLLTYEKGCAVLRMLEQYLGEETFRDGVRNYLKAHAYANTVTSDLWDAIEEVSGEPVRATMDTWILQGGHPLVRVDAHELAQEPFSYGPAPKGTTSAIGSSWRIPILVRALPAEPGGAGGAGIERERLFLAARSLPLPDMGGDTGVSVVNAGGWGTYRTAYDGAHLGRLAARLGELDTLERFNLLADTWALVLAGQAFLDDFLTLAASLGDDPDPSSWAVVTGALGLCDRVIDDQGGPALAAAVQALLGTRLASVGWDAAPGEGERVPSLRAQLIAASGVLGRDDEVREKAALRFEASRGGEPIDPDIESAVLAVVADQLRPGDYETVLERYRNPATPQEELRYLQALAAFPDEALALRTFELARSEVRTQNAPFLISALLANRGAGPAMWVQLKEHWDELLARFPLNSHSRMLDGAKALCHDRALADDVAAFLEAHPVERGPRTVTQMIERLYVNVAFGERERPGLAAALRGVAGDPPGST